MCSLKQPFVEIFLTLETAIVAYFQRQIQLSGFSAYPIGSPSQLVRISGVLLYLQDCIELEKVSDFQES
jgi:hypothetical protein